MRLIDAAALGIGKCTPNYLSSAYCVGWNAVIDIINNAPTIEAEPVKHGRWDDSGRYKFLNGDIAIRCSACGCCLHEDEYRCYNWNYCPNCGAKMELEGKE